MNTWLAERNLGMNGEGFEIDQDTIYDPHDMPWCVRKRSDEHVMAIMEKIRKFGKVPQQPAKLALPLPMVIRTMKSKGVGLWDAMSSIYGDDILEARPPQLLKFFDDQNIRKKPFAGDHTSEAYRRLRTEYPTTELWKTMKNVMIVVYDPEDSDDIRTLKACGLVDNEIASTHKKMSFVDKVVSIHSDYERHGFLAEIAKDYKFAIPSKFTAQQNYPALLGVTEETLGQIQTIAKTWGTEWTLCLRIMNGDMKVKGGKKKSEVKKDTASTYFYNPFSKHIPRDFRISLLQKLVDGVMSNQEVGNECKVFKAQQKVHAWVLDYIKTQAVSQLKVGEHQGGLKGAARKEMESRLLFTCWTDVTTQFPAIGHLKFIEQYYIQCKNQVKMVMPESLKTGIDKLIRDALNRRNLRVNTKN